MVLTSTVHARNELEQRRLALQAQQHPAGVFELVAHGGEESHSLAPVDETMVVGQGHVHHRPRLDLVPYSDSPVRRGVEAQDGALREVDDAGAIKPTEGAGVGDTEGRATQIVHAKLVLACFYCKLCELELDVVDRLGLDVPDHARHGPSRARDRQADVDIVAVNDLLALRVDERVDAGLLEEGASACFRVKRHESERVPMRLQEQVFVLPLQLDDGAHVCLLEGGEQSGRVLRILEPLHHPLPDEGQGHAPLLPALNSRGLDRHRLCGLWFRSRRGRRRNGRIWKSHALGCQPRESSSEPLQRFARRWRGRSSVRHRRWSGRWR
mmetsp:Transcript_114245/g.323049  ORF Transcript_114245/g.323049 Transcript_114245/m.323049 type:complete len:325 (+) Transcript_114245:128-1102(+)